MAFSTLREEIDWLLAQQPTLLRLGATASRLVEAEEMLRWLESKFGIRNLEDVELAEKLVKLLIDVLWSLGDETNPQANAARVLYGADPSSMGLPLKTRRGRAASCIVICGAEGARAISVSSFQRLREPQISQHVAWRMCRTRPMANRAQVN